LIVTDLELQEAVHYTLDFRGPGINLIHKARVAGGTLRAGDDAASARWFSPAGLPSRDRIAFRSHYVALDRWRQG
jgi:hypothetical protein